MLSFEGLGRLYDFGTEKVVECCKQRLMTCPCRSLQESAEIKSDKRSLEEEASEGKSTLIVTRLWQGSAKVCTCMKRLTMSKQVDQSKLYQSHFHINS